MAVSNLFLLFVFVNLSYAMIIQDNEKGNIESTIIFGGDTSFAGIVNYQVNHGKCTYNESFEVIRKEFSDKDHIVLNLESPFGDVNHHPKISTKMHPPWILSEPSSIEALKYFNVSAVTLANNHLMDFGEVSTNKTIDLLTRNHIQFSGITFGKKNFAKQKPVILESNGVKVGILAYCRRENGCITERHTQRVGVALFDKKHALEEAKQLRKIVDSVIIYFHMYREYTVLPSVESDLGRLVKSLSPYIDAVLISHQHVISSTLYIDGVLVMSGLGNFLFPMHMTQLKSFYINRKNKHFLAKDIAADEWYVMTKKYKNPSAFGMVAKLRFNKNGLVKHRTQYRVIEIDVNKRHCLYTKMKKGSKWITVCSKEDTYCVGTSTFFSHY